MNNTDGRPLSPFVPGERRYKANTPYDYFKIQKKEQLSDEYIHFKFSTWCRSIAVEECCMNILNKTPKLQCNCLEVISHSTEFCDAVAEYLMMFGQLKGDDQKKLMIEWMNQQISVSEKWVFPIPYITNGVDNHTFGRMKQARICKSALLRLFGRGRKWWFVCLKHSKSNTLPSHKLRGRVSNNKSRWNRKFKDDLIDHFEELRKETGPIATRFVREKTGTITLRDKSDKAEYLPPYLTKRACYAQFCLNRGYIITTDNKGSTIVTSTDDHSNDEEEEIPCWTAFHSFWNEYYPDLLVSRPAADICSHCYKFYNRHKYSKGELLSDTDDDDNNNEEVTTTETAAGPVQVDEITNQKEIDILQAAEHVKQARAQRLLVNKKVSKARDDRKNNIRHSERTYTLICDYSQNMALPHFGTSQPGDTYYLTPLNLFVFGVVDVSYIGLQDEEEDRLYAHLYKEGTGEKGGNNVASLIVKSLKQLNLMQNDLNNKPVKGKELNIIMDNCAGQNKNNHVILLAPYLVEMGYFDLVNIIFLITGHTKNVCDRRFNNLKHKYHKSQVFTMDEAVKVCSESQFVTVWPVDPLKDWFDYHTFFLKMYKQLSKAKLKIAKNHIFSCTKNTRTDINLSTRVADLSIYKEEVASITNSEFGKGMLESRQMLLRRAVPDRIIYAGIPEHKQVKLWKAYSLFIPKQLWNDVCPKPDAEVLEREEIDQKKRRNEKKTKSNKRKMIVADV